MAERTGTEKGRTSRASSTSSLGLEVRCGCQFYQTDSLLPERKALVGRPSSRNAVMQTPPPTQLSDSGPVAALQQDQQQLEGRWMSAPSDHEYEPIASPSMLLQGSLMKPRSALSGSAPVVRINDTDVVHVADSDESLDVQERRYNSKQLVLDGDVVVPLDGEIEDSAMQAKELGDTVGDTSEDQETAQQLQDRIEERFLFPTTPCTESRTDAEINTSQVDSSALEEEPLRRGARGFPDRLRSQAGKLRTRLRGIQRPSFSLPERQKTEKTKTTKVEKPKIVKPAKPAKTEKSRFSLPERPKFNFPERPKFNFPERPKFNFPERPKFNIKKPNINLPTLGRVRKPLKERQNSSESATSGSKRNIFDFSTYPRIFDKKSKSRGEYATSSPKPSRAQSPESATVPRVKKKAPIGARWVQRFSDIKYADDEPENAVERSKPWRRPSTEEPQVAFRPEPAASRDRLPWEESEERSMGESRERGEDESVPEPIEKREDEDEVEYIDEDSVELENRRIVVALPIGSGFAEDLEDVVPDPRLYPRGLEEDSYESRTKGIKQKWLEEPLDVDHEIGEEIPHPDSYGHEDYSGEMIPEDAYGGNFMPIDPPRNLYMPREATPEESSLRSDREQQSSGGSSCDRRRRGVLEEIDSDEFFLRAKGISQDDVAMGRFLASEIRDAFRPTGNALADHDQDLDPALPPTRPVRTRSMRKRRDENPPESHDATPPARPKRDRRRSEDSLQQVDDYERFLTREKTGSISSSRHRVIYQTEGTPRPVEPLDDIVVVKPARRKSRSVARSYSEFDSEVLQHPLPPTPPVAPRRRKRGRRQPDTNGAVPNGHATSGAVVNGHRQDIRDWQEAINFPPEAHEDPEILQEEKLETLVNRLDHEYIEPAPMAPKRRSRSRGTSVADDDRTSRGAESLPEVGYLEEDDEGVPRDTDSRDLPGYAVVDKKEKPPRPPPPRRRRDKFATSPKPKSTSTPEVPVRPRRAYSTLGPSRRRSSSEDRDQNPLDVTPYTELDSDDPDSRDLRSGLIVNKIQGRPLPAPPRPPRARRDPSEPENEVVEMAASTQTDPLPDDLVIEEEVTRAKLVMAPSRSGSQILVSTERIASPTFGRSSPAVPPLPGLLDLERLRPSQTPDLGESAGEEEFEKEETAEDFGAKLHEERPQTPVTPASSLPLPHEDRIRIASLEVADLRVERLNVNQLEAHKISASEVDAVVVSASEISGASNSGESIHPELLRELIAIRSQLEQVQAQVNAGEKKMKEETRSEVQQLIDSLKESDKDKEEKDLMEESERIEDQEMKELEKELEKSAEEEKSVEVVPEESSKAELDTQSTEEVKVTQEPPKLEEGIDSSPQESAASDSTLPPSPVLETPQAQISPSLPTPVKEEAIEFQGQEDRSKVSRSRSSSPSRDGKRFVRQTASPVKSLPPLISVTPDTPDPVPSPVPETQVQPQRAIVSYMENDEESVQRQPNAGVTQYVAFPTSQIPPSFFALASPTPTSSESEPSIPEMTLQLMRAMRLAGTRAMRHFVGYVVSRVNVEDRGEKTKEIELAICALLLLIAGLLILCFGSPRTVTHHHHWDYFNPPQ